MNRSCVGSEMRVKEAKRRLAQVIVKRAETRRTVQRRLGREVMAARRPKTSRRARGERVVDECRGCRGASGVDGLCNARIPTAWPAKLASWLWHSGCRRDGEETRMRGGETQIQLRYAAGFVCLSSHCRLLIFAARMASAGW